MAGVLAMLALAACTGDDDASPTKTTAEGTTTVVGIDGGRATGAAPRGSATGETTSAGATSASAGSPGNGEVPPLLSTLPVDPSVALLPYYRDVLKAEESLAECYAAAGGAEGLTNVADLAAAEADPVLTGRLIAAFDACEQAG